MAMNFQIIVSCIVTRVVLQRDTDVSEEHAAFIFRVYICRLRNLLRKGAYKIVFKE
jgi:hypothetical protein